MIIWEQKFASWNWMRKNLMLFVSFHIINKRLNCQHVQDWWPLNENLNLLKTRFTQFSTINAPFGLQRSVFIALSKPTNWKFKHDSECKANSMENHFFFSLYNSSFYLNFDDKLMSTLNDNIWDLLFKDDIQRKANENWLQLKHNLHSNWLHL